MTNAETKEIARSIVDQMSDDDIAQFDASEWFEGVTMMTPEGIDASDVLDEIENIMSDMEKMGG